MSDAFANGYHTWRPLVAFVPNTTNSGSATLNVAGLGAKTLKESDCSTNLSASALTGGTMYLFSYNGTYFCQGSSSGGGGGSGNTVYCVGSASATAATCAGVPSGATTYTGMSGAFTAGATSTGAPLTVNVNSLGAKNVYLNGAATSTTNFVISGQVYAMTYDGTEIQLSQPISSPDRSRLAPVHHRSLVLVR